MAFEDGDPERPILLGSLWNGVQQAPREEFFGSDIPANDIKRIVTKSGNRLQMVDTPGRETVVVATPNHTSMAMTEKSDATGRELVALHSDGDIVLSAPAGRVHFQSKYFSREVGDEAAAPAATLVPAAYHPPAPTNALQTNADPIQWMHYKKSTSRCAPVVRMNAEQKKNASKKDHEAVPGGPAYTTNGAPLSDYTGWKDQGISDSRACAIKGIAANEGNDFSAVQSYDSQTLSAGSMQKTINPLGNGELSQQMSDFKDNNPAKYKTLFAEKGWTVESAPHGSPTSYFQDPSDSAAPRLTGEALKSYIRQCNGNNFEKTMQPWRDAGRDADFQNQQIQDYKKRLTDTASQQVHSQGKNTGYSIGDYFSSSKGLAHAADYGVNSGMNGLKTTFSSALDRYTSSAHPPADPTQWTDAQRAGLLSQFQTTTGSDLYDEKGNALDRTKRWNSLDNTKCLSDQSGSSQ